MNFSSLFDVAGFSFRCADIDEEEGFLTLSDRLKVGFVSSGAGFAARRHYMKKPGRASSRHNGSIFLHVIFWKIRLDTFPARGIKLV
jgi:hypothetical protein